MDRIYGMEQLLLWYSKNNSVMIQFLSIVIGLLLCFFIFRLFFATKNSGANATPAEAKPVGSIENLESKVNQILQMQNKKTDTVSGQVDVAVTSEETAVLISKIQAENLELKQMIKTNGAVGAAQAQAQLQSVDYKKEIEDLKNRLSDYEVIAEDIADLQKLREENKSLLEQLQTKNAPVEDTSEDAREDINVIQNSAVSEQDKDLLQQFDKLKGT